MAIGDQEGLSSSSLAGEKVVHSQHMGVGDIRHIGEIVKSQCIADDERRFEFGDALLDGGDELVVSRAADDRWPDGTSHHLFAVRFKHESFCSYLEEVLEIEYANVEQPDLGLAVY